jgi:PIN domain nuclease of toxin-antitoxin system
VRVLLDAHALIWWMDADAALSRRARATIADSANECLFSIASAWEMAIKISLGRLTGRGRIDRDLPDQLAANGFSMLPIEIGHVARAANLPFHHRDPFDRLLAAQALEEELPIVSADKVFRGYGVTRIW